MRLCIHTAVFWALLGHISSSSDLAQPTQLLGNITYEYRGCYHKYGDCYYNLRLKQFSTLECLKSCYDNGYEYAGIGKNFNNTCCCTHVTFISHLGRANEETECTCKEDNLSCGGDDRLSVYLIKPPLYSSNEQEEIESKFGEEQEPWLLITGPGGIFSYETPTHRLRHVIEVSFKIDAVDYILIRKEGFAIWNEGIYRFPLFENELLQEHEADLIGNVNHCPTFAVDWHHNKIFWPDCYGHDIRVQDLNETLDSHDTIVQLHEEGAWALDMVVDPYQGLLFWTTGAVLWSVRLDGKNLKKIVPEFPVNRVTSLSLDLANNRVFFSGLDKHDKNSSKLYFVGSNGVLSDSQQFSEYEGGTRILSFGIFYPHIHFIKDINGSTSIILHSKLDYNHRPSDVLKESNYRQGKLLKLVHHRLQAPPKIDVCTNYNCSHMCAIEDSRPQCSCFRSSRLARDNKTCEFIDYTIEEESLFVKIFFVLVTIVMVVFGAGVLMCVCDKIWSQLHPTIVTLSVPGASKRTFTGQRRQDAVNLI